MNMGVIQEDKFNTFEDECNTEEVLVKDQEDELDDNCRKRLREFLNSRSLVVVEKKEKTISKVQKLTNKLKKITECEKNKIISDLDRLDVKLFISEITNNICECNFKLKDIYSVVEVIIVIKCEYSVFEEHLIGSINKSFCNIICQLNSIFNNTLSVPNLSSSLSVLYWTKYRLLLRLYGELLVLDICSDIDLMRKMIWELINIWEKYVAAFWFNNEENILDFFHNCLSNSTIVGHQEILKTLEALTNCYTSIQTFVQKFGFCIFGINILESLKACKKNLNLCDSTKSNRFFHNETLGKNKEIISIFAVLKSFVRKYYFLVPLLLFFLLTNQKQIVNEIKINKGFVDTDNENLFLYLSNSFAKSLKQSTTFILHLALTNFNDFTDANNKEIDPFSCLTYSYVQHYVSGGVGKPGDQSLKVTKIGRNEDLIPETTENHQSGLANDPVIGTKEEIVNNYMWDDDKEKDFYTKLFDLREAIPLTVLGVSKETTVETLDKTKGNGQCKPNQSNASESNPEDPSQTDISEIAEKTISSPSTAQCLSTNADSNPEETPNLVFSEKSEIFSFENYLQKLSRASDASHIDVLAADFFYERLNNKSNRRRVSKFLLCRTHLHFLPLCGRLLATIGPYCKDVVQTVVEGLLTEVKKHMSEKNPMEIEAKIRIVRFISELTKFDLIPPGVVMDILNNCLEDFTHHHAEMASHIVQCSGRFLLYNPTTSTRFRNLLDKMLRLCAARHLPVKLEIQLEDAYYQLRPTTILSNKRVNAKGEEVPLMKIFLRHLVSHQLKSDEDDNTVVKILRKLDWNDVQVTRWLLKAITELNYSVAYERLNRIAGLLSGIARIRPDFVIFLIDCLMEDIQIGMEACSHFDSARRIRQIKFFGELYNYRLIDSSVVLDMLYHLIGFGGATCYRAGYTARPHKLLQTINCFLNQSYESKPKLQTINEQSDTFLNDLPNEKSPTMLPVILPPVPLIDIGAPPDEPNDYFHIRLICVLLDCVGEYFTKGAHRLKLDRFILFFQRYLFFKKPIPLRVRNIIDDTLSSLRPNLVTYDSLEKIDEDITLLMQREADVLNRLSSELGEEELCLPVEEEKEILEDICASEESNGDENTESSVDRETDDYDYERNPICTAEELELDRELEQIINESLSNAFQNSNYRRGASISDIGTILKNPNMLSNIQKVEEHNNATDRVSWKSFQQSKGDFTDTNGKIFVNLKFLGKKNNKLNIKPLSVPTSNMKLLLPSALLDGKRFDDGTRGYLASNETKHQSSSLNNVELSPKELFSLVASVKQQQKVQEQAEKQQMKKCVLQQFERTQIEDVANTEAGIRKGFYQAQSKYEPGSSEKQWEEDFRPIPSANKRSVYKHKRTANKRQSKTKKN